MKSVSSVILLSAIISQTAVAGNNTHNNTHNNTYNNVHHNVHNTTHTSVKNTNNNINKNMSKSVSNAEASSASYSASGAVAQNGDVSVGGDVYEARRIPVATAYAASLTSGIDTCLGSASAGVQTMVVGVSGGKTFIDRNCILIKQVQLLTQMGYLEAACFRARMGEEGEAIDEAMKQAGVDCVAKPVTVAIPENVVTKDELADHEKRIVQKLSEK